MDNIKRITSGVIIGIALAIILLIPNNMIIGIIFAVIAATAMHEYLNAISKVCKPVKWLAYLSCIIVTIPSFISTKKFEQYLIFAIPIILVLLFAEVIATDMKTSFKDIAYTLLGICYIPTFLMFMTMTEKLQNGKFLLGYIFIAAWGTDIFAYSVGRRIGKHKFSKVSPKKSIEGCVGGTVGSILLAIILTLILNNNFGFEYSYTTVILSTLVLSLVGQLGDFAASSIKRYVDIKDYGKLLPGHGGMLDRIDSVIFIAPFAYLLFTKILVI